LKGPDGSLHNSDRLLRGPDGSLHNSDRLLRGPDGSLHNSDRLLRGPHQKLKLNNFYDVVDLMIRGCANNERQFALKIIAPTFKSNVLHHHGRPWAAPLSISQQLFEQQFLKSNTFFDIIDGDLKLLRCRIFDYIFNECYGFDNRHDPLSAIKQLCPDAPIDNLETCSQYFFEKFGLEMR
jgi:hypothetical protein